MKIREEQFKQLIDSNPMPWDNLRQKNWQRFTENGIPNKSWENWKYTPLKRFEEVKFNSIIQKNTESNLVIDQKQLTLNIVNGSLDFNEQTKLPEGLTLLPLSIAWKKGLITEEDFNSLDNPDNPYFNLNNAFFKEGVFLQVQDSYDSKLTIKINHINKTDDSPMIHSQVYCKVLKNSHAYLWEDYSGQPDTRATNAVSKIILGKDSTLTHIKTSKTDDSTFHHDQSLVNIEANATYDSLVLYSGNGLSRNEIKTNLLGENSISNLYGLYLPTGNGHNEHYSEINHNHARTYSEQLYKGILEEDSMAVFSGTVKVGEKAIGVNSNQLNKNLLLSKSARVETMPQLLIATDDVKCAHGATIGQLNENELFYLQARGVPKCRAYELLASAFAKEVLLKLKNKEIIEKLDELITINSEEAMEHIHV